MPKSSLTIQTQSAEETKTLGETLAKSLPKGSIVCLYGELGSGKTTMVKGMARGLKLKEDDVTSPTFVLMNIYEGKQTMHHFDFYRIEHVRDLDAIGYEEFIYSDAISVIEWPQKMKQYLPKEYLKVELKPKKGNLRSIRISSIGQRYRECVDHISSKQNS